MSKPLKKILPYVIGFVVISIAFAYFISHFFKHPEVSINLNEKAQHSHLEFAKHKKPIFVYIADTSSLYEKARGITRLTGVIQVNQIKSDILYAKWELPENVRIVHGDVEQSIQNISQGQSYQVILEVENLQTDIAQNIILHGQFRFSDFILGSSAVYSSNPDETAEGQVLRKLEESN